MRADKYFAEVFGSRTKAAEAIEKGLVLVNGREIKAKTEIKDTDVISFIQAEEYFVSNGGYKLNRALKEFAFDCQNKVFADIGASTGGFTDCLLQRGAKKVYAVDVGESLLHESLLTDSRIVRKENCNARYLRKEDFEDTLDGVVADVSFISLRLIFPVIKEILKADGDAFVLIKPQFECEKKYIGKSGIVSPGLHTDIVKKVLKELSESAMYPIDIINAPIRKGKNIEYILRIRPQNIGVMTDKVVVEKVKNIVKQNSLGELV